MILLLFEMIKCPCCMSSRLDVKQNQTLCMKKVISARNKIVLNVAKILLIIFQTNYSVLFFLKKKKWAKDIIILEEFALCTKFHEFDDERETFMNCTFVRVLKIMILFLPKLDLFSQYSKILANWSVLSGRECVRNSQ